MAGQARRWWTAGLWAAALALWTLLAVRLNVRFVESIGTFTDPQGYEQERDALRRGAVALYTAGHHAGHGLAVVIGAYLGAYLGTRPAALSRSVLAGLVLAVAQAVVAYPLTVAQLASWDEGGDYSFSATMLDDPVVLVPVLAALLAYPLLAAIGGWLGARRQEQGARRQEQGARREEQGARRQEQGARRGRLLALLVWSLAGPLYLFAFSAGPPSQASGWILATACWLVAIGLLLVVPLVLAGRRLIRSGR